MRIGFKFGAILLLALSSRALEAQEVVLVAHASIKTEQLTVEQVTKLFLKQSAKWPDGTSAHPVDQQKTTGIRAIFSKVWLGRPVGAVETYWQQQIFTGKDVPPPTKASDDDVLAFVRATPGAVGYVSPSASTSGVKVVPVR